MEREQSLYPHLRILLQHHHQHLIISLSIGKLADDLVTGLASATNNDICSFNSTTGKIIQDSGIVTSNLFLKDGSVTATGNFNMGTHEINYISAIRPVDTNIDIGNTISLPLGGTGNIVLGDLTTVTASNAVCVGLQNIARGNLWNRNCCRYQC